MSYHVANPGDVVEFVGTNMDIAVQGPARAALQKAMDELKRSEDLLHAVVDTILALIWPTQPNDAAELFNQPCLDYTDLSIVQATACQQTIPTVMGDDPAEQKICKRAIQ
jgi:hypothetical protein